MSTFHNNIYYLCNCFPQREINFETEGVPYGICITISMRFCNLYYVFIFSLHVANLHFFKHPIDSDHCFCIMADWEDIQEKFFKKTRLMGNEKGCIQWVGCKKGGTGYGTQVVKWSKDEEGKKEAAHRLAYMIRHKLTRYDMPRVDQNNNKVECSHICHTKLCVNADHITIEPHAINQERIHCKDQGHCSKCHKPYCLI